MGAYSENVLGVVSGWESVELVLKCVFVGLWQMINLAVRRLWKGHRRKISRNYPPVELTVDSSIGIHCYIKIMGVKYHYVETGPKDGKIVLILGDAPDTEYLWVPSWSSVVRRLAELGHHVVTLDLRGTGASEAGDRCDMSPPAAVEELKSLLLALGASDRNPAILIGFGIGGMLTWYFTHCEESMVSKFAVISAPHPNLYWQHPPAAFCQDSLFFIQWPYFPERWLAEGALQEGTQWASSRARDWSGALNYVRGAAWYRIHSDHKVQARGLLVGSRDSAAQLVASAQYCANPALRLVSNPGPGDKDLPGLILDFFVDHIITTHQATEIPRSLMSRVLDAVTNRGRELMEIFALSGKQKLPEEIPKGLVGRVLGAVADRGRGLTARLALPPNA